MKPHCEMDSECTAEVTHIGSKGYVYCAEHAVTRRGSGWEQTRRMRAWERRLIESGKPLPSYEPRPRPVHNLSMYTTVQRFPNGYRAAVWKRARGVPNSPVVVSVFLRSDVSAVDQDRAPLLRTALGRADQLTASAQSDNQTGKQS